MNDVKNRIVELKKMRVLKVEELNKMREYLNILERDIISINGGIFELEKILKEKEEKEEKEE